jgi:hypothetical protein
MHQTPLADFIQSDDRNAVLSVDVEEFVESAGVGTNSRIQQLDFASRNLIAVRLRA